ncbi:MAG: L,D-transpeptidase family protein [Lachnospiraceae bacterium]|nr:L,D-transpeptidase family protein [Lachnospiraceae bacterium]
MAVNAKSIIRKRRAGRTKEKEKHSAGSVILIALSVVVLLYLAAALFFSFHFLPNTTVNGVSVGWMSAGRAKTKLLEASRSYTLTVTDCDGNQSSIPGENLSLEFLNGENVDDILKAQSAMLWAANTSEEKIYDVKFQVSYDQEVLAEAIDANKAFHEENMAAPENAYFDLDENGYAVIVPEVMGSTIDADAAAQAVGNAIQYMTEEVDLTDFRTDPEILSTDETLNNEMNTWNAYMGAAGSTYSFYNQNETLDSSTVSSLLKLEDGQAVIDTDAVSSLVSGWADTYNTYHTYFEIESMGGGTASVSGSDGTYGYTVDQDATYSTIIDNLNAGEVQENSPSYSHEGTGSDNWGLGSTYVEVDTTKQHMWLVVDNEVLVSTDVITGSADSSDTETRHGVFYITDKARNITLGTYEVQGYEVDVAVWMRFNNSGQGIHDCTWRDSWEFGSNAYLSDGSHGCINTPSSAAEEIFTNVSVGTPVFIHY